MCGPAESELLKQLDKKGGKGMRLGPGAGVDLSTRTGYFRVLTTLREQRPKFLALWLPDDAISKNKRHQV